jgi:GNAT superfamily N-acetyltransferase
MPDTAASVATAPYAIRPAKPEDAAFILGCWLEQWWKESAWAHRVRAREYFAGHRPLVVSILEHASALVACDAEDADALLGFIVFEPEYAGGPVVDLAYVKKAFRGLGIGRALLAASGLPQDLADVRLTHCTRAWFTTKANGPGIEARFPNAIHNPYLAWRHAPRT